MTCRALQSYPLLGIRRPTCKYISKLPRSYFFCTDVVFNRDAILRLPIIDYPQLEEIQSIFLITRFSVAVMQFVK